MRILGCTFWYVSATPPTVSGFVYLPSVTLLKGRERLLLFTILHCYPTLVTSSGILPARNVRPLRIPHAFVLPWLETHRATFPGLFSHILLRDGPSTRTLYVPELSGVGHVISQRLSPPVLPPLTAPIAQKLRFNTDGLRPPPTRKATLGALQSRLRPTNDQQELILCLRPAASLPRNIKESI
ncbi:hypothetical protein BS47DRAFT_908693 [Hydnum rufescens UP504]|uniref:Uncharacterized protein n=1 Tax=Hydnum rufescens UP504 TaxID=1448309 RepID=A0A9P6DWP8_9AGAM|nr:hypothetical protein BS47DRAFT_908693 [Hydnum rufescens UP504]